MSAKRRCKVCAHRPGPRAVTATVKEPKPAMRDLTAPRQHKKVCTCECHTVVTPRQEARIADTEFRAERAS